MFDLSTTAMQFFERYDWIPALISYEVGVDGISLLLIVLTTFLTPLTLLPPGIVSMPAREFMICMLFLESGMVGVFAAIDLFLFYVFGSHADPDVFLNRRLGRPTAYIRCHQIYPLHHGW